ncbi:hypothetical protein BH11PSE5_BH11PSE5_17170 [soil metagenome]
MGKILQLSVCAAALASLAAYGAGGVNSPGSSAPPTPAPPPIPTPTPAPAPTATPPSPSASAEYAFSVAGVKSNAGAAYDRGITGKDVTVAIIDSGIDVTGPEFANRLSVDSKSFDASIARCGTCAAENVSFDLNDIKGHGKDVTSVAAGGANGYGTQGIAYDATILVLKIANPDFTGITPTSVVKEGDGINTLNLAPAISYAVDKGAFVINISSNGYSTGQLAADQRAAMDKVRLNNRLVVESVSNSTGQDSFAGQIAENLVGADFTNKDWFLFGIRVDASLNAPTDNGVPGALADRTLSVAALNIQAVGINNEIVSINGNSFAAPAIAGAAALLKQYWPQLGGKEMGLDCVHI